MKNGTLASPAMARASSVLPVPGGPTSSAPRGMRPPRRWNFCGSRRNSTISCSSSLASSTPATSSNVTRPWRSVSSLALRLAEAHGAAAARLHLAHEEDPHPDQQQHGEPVEQHAHDRGHVLIRRTRAELDALLLQPLDEGRILRSVGGEGGAAVAHGAVDAVAGERHVGDVAAVDRGQELRVGDLGAAPALGRVVEQIEQGREQDENGNPDGKLLKVRVHFVPCRARNQRGPTLCPDTVRTPPRSSPLT